MRRSPSGSPSNWVDGLQGRGRAGGGLRDLDLGQRLRQFAGEIVADGDASSRSGRAERCRRACENRSSVNDLRLDLPGGLGADALDDLLGLGEGVGVGPAVGHREAVVQQHDVMRARAAQQVAPLVAQQRLGDQQHDRRDGRHPQQQQQQLLEDDPGAVLLLAEQQELHRRPLDPPVPHHVDQVDQHGAQPTIGRPQSSRAGWRKEGMLIYSCGAFPTGCSDTRPRRRPAAGWCGAGT